MRCKLHAILSERPLAAAIAEINTAEPGTVACAWMLTIQQGAPVSKAQTRRNVLGTRAWRRTWSAQPYDREIEPDMTIYPVDFHRRSERKWAHRVGAAQACESTPRAAPASRNQRVRSDGTRNGRVVAPYQERDDILARRPWLLAIGQGLQAECSTFEQPVPERLAARLKELEGSPPGD